LLVPGTILPSERSLNLELLKGLSISLAHPCLSHCHSPYVEPDYQHNTLPKSDQKLLKGFHGIPDIAYNADAATAILVFTSFLGPKNTGYYFIGGTSEGSPQWAGLIADGNQLAPIRDTPLARTWYATSNFRKNRIYVPISLDKSVVSHVYSFMELLFYIP